MTPPAAQARIERLLEHSTWIRGLARQLASDPGTADDLVQKTWLAALERRFDPSADGSSLRRWLATVLRNFARQERRGEGRRSVHEERAARPEGQPSTLDVVARASVQRELVEEVLTLEEPYRTTILLRFFDGLPPRAIAKRMSVPVDTVRTRVARGLARLRDRLDERRGGDRSAWLAAFVPLLHPPSSLSPTLLGASLVNAKIPIAAAALVVGGALTVYLATRPAGAEAKEPAPRAAALPEAERKGAPAPSAAALSAEAPAQGTASRAPAPLSTTGAVVGDVAAEPMILRGRVFDDLGAPVSGVRVALQSDGGPRENLGEATSGSGGLFEMPFPKNGGRLVCSDERYATVLAGLCGSEPGSEPIVVIAPRVEVSGRVVGEEGFPLPGARVEIEVPEDLRTRFRRVLDRSASLSFAATADERGSFAIDAAPRVEGARLHATSDGYSAFSGTLAEHSGSGLVITLERPRSEDGLLRGKVVDAAGGPVAGARVAFGIDVVRSEEDGSFTFKLSDPQSYAARFHVPPTELVAVKKGFLPARYEPPIVQGEPSWPSTVLLRLGETPLSIEGRVVDHRREPFPGATVWIADATLLGAGERGPLHVENVLAGAEEANWRKIAADGDGRFRIEGLLPREYRIRAMDAETLLIAEDGPFPAGASDVEIRLPTDELYPKVAGRVVSHSGKPIAGARIFPMCDAFQVRMKGQIISTSHEAVEGTTTGADGRFELENVPKSLVYIRIQGDEILPLEYGRYVEGDERFANTTVRGLPKDRIDDLEIVVDTRCHLQIELADPSTADAVSILDVEGRPIVINIIAGNSRREDERVEIVDGRSYPMAVPDTARTIVLYKGPIEVSRTTVELTPGELKQVRL